MTGWLMLGLLGGVVALDATSFPQAMVSRPLVAGTLAGALFGRPLDGLAIGFVMEAFALISLPIGASRYPEPGLAAVSAAGAYVTATAPGAAAGPLVVAIAAAFLWEWVAGETVVLHRRRNGQRLTRHGGLDGRELEREHLSAMTMDFIRGAAVSVAGGLIGYGLLAVVQAYWGLPETVTLGALTLLVAAMVGTTLPLFGGARARLVPWGAGAVVGMVLLVLL